MHHLYAARWQSTDSHLFDWAMIVGTTNVKAWLGHCYQYWPVWLMVTKYQLVADWNIELVEQSIAGNFNHGLFNMAPANHCSSDMAPAKTNGSTQLVHSWCQHGSTCPHCSSDRGASLQAYFGGCGVEEWQRSMASVKDMNHQLSH